MTILRQYSLPNCTLILEGLADMTTPSNLLDIRPVMSILMSAECHLVGHAQPLTGGREFFESLVQAVSRYAQEFLSGIPVPETHHPKPSLVHLQPIDKTLHRVTLLESESNHETQGTEKGKVVMSLDLTTVQLFDLVEAVDQFLADSQTLPDLSLKLKPISRHAVQVGEPITKRALPAAVGVSSLAIAGIAFFFVPIPEVQRPKEPIPQPNANSRNVITPTPSGSGTPNPTATPLSPQDLKTSETTTPQITDPTKLRDIRSQLENQLKEKWTTTPTFSEDLIYQVSVGEDGAIVSYKGIKVTPNNEIETLLSQLVYKQVGNRTNEALAEFKVIFSAKGTLEIMNWEEMTTPSPSYSSPSSSTPSSSPSSP
jgi:hypothetical protein